MVVSKRVRRVPGESDQRQVPPVEIQQRATLSPTPGTSTALPAAESAQPPLANRLRWQTVSVGKFCGIVTVGGTIPHDFLVRRGCHRHSVDSSRRASRSDRSSGACPDPAPTMRRPAPGRRTAPSNASGADSHLRELTISREIVTVSVTVPQNFRVGTVSFRKSVGSCRPPSRSHRKSGRRRGRASGRGT